MSTPAPAADTLAIGAFILSVRTSPDALIPALGPPLFDESADGYRYVGWPGLDIAIYNERILTCVVTEGSPAQTAEGIAVGSPEADLAPWGPPSSTFGSGAVDFRAWDPRGVSVALAATVAVLPLEQGAGGTPFEGLGKALAGMLTTDLASAPGVELVERARLDAMLAEIELSKSNFLDPNTAQTLGRGVGAQYVVMGSYSVLGDAFLLDARLVGVETARVVRAANAQGTLSTFVDVEKQLVTGLLDGLDVTLAEDVRARLLAAAPTRDFQAFAAYGEGVALQDAGKILAAREAYGHALEADGRRARQQARHEELEAVIARFPPPKDAKDMRSLPGFVLRMAALGEQGRH